MKIIIAAILIILSDTASAGFLTGVIVGNALSGDSTPQSSSTQLLASDNNDIIVCRKMRGMNRCHVGSKVKGIYTVSMTPSSYIKHNGYTTLIKQAAIIQGDQQYIVMEVK